MAADWSRRAYLSSLATVAVAGCTGSSDTATPTHSADPHPGRGTPPATSATPPPTTAASPDPPAKFETSWPMPSADPGSSNAVSAPGPTASVRRLWETSLGGDGSPPILADGNVFVGLNSGRVVALDARTGKRQWHTPLDQPAGRPWALGDRLVVPTPGGLVSLTLADGTVQWRVTTTDRVGLVVAPTGVFALEKGAPPGVVAFALGDGSRQWRTTIEEPWAPPVIAGTKRVFVSSGTHDVRFWTLDADSGERVGKAPRPGSDFPAEHFYRDGSVYAVDAFFGHIRASAVSSHGHGWSQGVGAVGRAAMSGDDDQIFYAATHGDRPGLYALSTTDGTVQWSVPVATDRLFRPVVAQDVVLLRTGDSLRAFDPAKGTTLWHQSADPFGKQIIVVDDVLLTTAAGTVRAFRPA